MTFPHCKKTCPECPWLRDVPPGKFTPSRFIALAPTAYDLAMTVFACHQSPEGREFTCAGAALRLHHNLRLRLARIDRRAIQATGDLYNDYREMAVANGVPTDHPALERCR